MADGDSVLSARSTRRLLDHVRGDLAAEAGGGAKADNGPESASATPPSGGGAPDPRAGAALAELTAREREFLQQMALGLTNAELGAHFVVSEATVKTHVGRILAKTGSRDRVQAVLTAFRAGLVTPGDL